MPASERSALVFILQSILRREGLVPFDPRPQIAHVKAYAEDDAYGKDRSRDGFCEVCVRLPSGQRMDEELNVTLILNRLAQSCSHPPVNIGAETVACAKPDPQNKPGSSGSRQRGKMPAPRPCPNPA